MRIREQVGVTVIEGRAREREVRKERERERANELYTQAG